MKARLLLDEMFAPDLASALTKRGHDVLAVVMEPALVGLADERLLEWATERERCLVTENVRDFELLRRAWASQGRTHAGLLYSSHRRFPRGRRYLGGLVDALDRTVAGGQVPGPDEVSWLS